MALKDLNWKQFMMQKGERVALGVAGFLTILLIGLNIKSYLNAGPAKHASALNAKTKDLDGKLRTNTPSRPDDLPEKADDALKNFTSTTINDSSQFAMQPLFLQSMPIDMNRRQPDLYPPVEGKVAIVQAQLWSYMLETDKRTGKLLIKVLLDAAGMPPATGQVDNQKSAIGRNIGGRGAAGLGGPGIGGRNMLGGTNTRDFLDSGTAKEGEFIPVDQLEAKANATLLRTIRPVRMAEIVASFPYKKQVLQFKDKLHMNSIREVLEELSLEKVDVNPDDPSAGEQALEAFRFLGVELQRRQVDRQGRVIFPEAGENGYVLLDAEKEYKPLLVLSNLVTEEEDPQLDDVIVDGTVMPRLASARENQYPKIELELPTLAKTLETLTAERSAGAYVPKVTDFTADTFRVFRKQPLNNGNPGTGLKPPPPAKGPGVGTGSGGPRVPGGVRPLGGRVPGAPGTPAQDDKFTIPDYCLIRVLDVTVKPGESYQYRLRVRMGNPNKLRKDVANPNDADLPELVWSSDKSQRWLEIGGITTVPTELHYYALDTKVVEKNYTGAYKDANVSRDQTVLQIHKYLENAAPGKGKNVPVGEWSVAERVIVARGEIIDRNVRVEVPVFLEEEHKWKLASTASTSGGSREQGIDVPFVGVPGRPTLLVDFDGGQLKYKRGTDEVKENTAAEVLIMGPDGRLLAHNSAIDAADKDRMDMVTAWRTRIEALRKEMSADPKDPNKGTGAQQFDSYGRPIRPKPGAPGRG
jgi:hypothetical protein